MHALYIVATISYALGLLTYFEQRKQIKTSQVLLLVLCFVAMFSYTAGTYAVGLETLKFCDLLFSLSMIMALMYMAFIAAELCMYPFGKMEKAFFITILGVLFLIKTDPLELYWYYFSIKIARVNGFSYLITEKGPAFYLTVIFILLCFIKMFRLITITIKSNKQVSHKTCMKLVIITLIISGSYIISMVTGSRYNLLPLVLPVVQFFIIWLFRSISLHDMNNTYASVFEQKEEQCFMCFDGKRNYLGCSKVCHRMFPELDELQVDEQISPSRTLKIRPVLNKIDDMVDDNNYHVIDLANNEMSLSCKAHSIIVHRRLIGLLIEIHDITKDQKEKRMLDRSNQLLEAELAIQAEKIQRMQGSIITGMARMVESRDNSTGGHINRTSAGVRCFIEHIADNYAFPWCTTDFCLNIIEAAPLHDLGKIAINDEILRKEGKFTPEEFSIMKKHTEEGAKIVPIVLGQVENEGFKKIAENVAHYHHEKWDGSGYPCGLKGEEIPIEARIMALADVFDALVSKRCYKDAFSYDNAFDIIHDSLGTQFDPELGDIFLECRPMLEDVYNRFEVQKE